MPGVLTACSSQNSQGADGSGASGATVAGSTGIKTSQVPVGEAAVVQVERKPIVIAQPTEGNFVAFSAKCTHQGAAVRSEEGMTLTCPLHGSQFKADTGEVVQGPANSPLTQFTVTVENDEFVLG